MICDIFTAYSIIVSEYLLYDTTKTISMHIWNGNLWKIVTRNVNDSKAVKAIYCWKVVLQFFRILEEYVRTLLLGKGVQKINLLVQNFYWLSKSSCDWIVSLLCPWTLAWWWIIAILCKFFSYAVLGIFVRSYYMFFLLWYVV